MSTASERLDLEEFNDEISQILKEIRINATELESVKRVFHGRGKFFEGLEGLSIDSFNDTLLLTSFSDYDHNLYLALVDAVFSEFEGVWSRALLQKRRDENTWILLRGDEQKTQEIAENGLKFKIYLENMQNLGFFLDMKNGRSFIRENSQGKSVLNLFAYTCSLSVAALEGGASEVCSVDMAKGALSRGRDNHRLNGQDLQKIKFMSHDILRSLKNISNKGPFDTVIIDPPSNQGKSFKVERDYPKIIRRLPEMLRPGSLVMACLNAPHLDDVYLKDLFSSDQFQFESKIPNPPEFKEKTPSEGLKVHLYRFQPGN